jgi:hypothetical protein
MAREHDTQAAEQLSREAEHLLAEYFRIRREYNALDRDNPAHADRRAALKGRYHELDRKYTELVKTQDDLVEVVQGPAQSRADVLWEGALTSEARVQTPVEPLSPDAPWIELTTPIEGAATDKLFEEALRRVEGDTPTDTAGPTDETPAESAKRGNAAMSDGVGHPVEVDGDVSTPFPETDLSEDEETPTPSGAGDGSSLVGTFPFAVDALRELTEHLRSGRLDEIDRELAEPALPSQHVTSGFTPQTPEPYVEIDHEPAKPILPRPPRQRAVVSKPEKEPAAQAIACPSCGERLPAGTEACRYCGARLISADTAEGMAAIVPPHLQIQVSESKPKAHLGSKLLMTVGWILVLASAAWLVVLNFDLWPEQINAWLDANRLGVLREDQSGVILGIAVVLLGGTLIGVGLFATRFIRVVVSLHELARNGRVEVIEKLIAEGRELDARDERGCTPLHFAVVAKQREVVAVLVGNGADVNSHNNRGDTPLHMSVANRDHALVQYLMKKGADAETINDGGSTLMHVAAQVGDVGLLKLFLERGLLIDQKTKIGFTPLHFAAQSGHDDAIEFLLDNGADPNAASDHGTTPIFPATRNGHLNAVRLLVAAGADFNARRGHDFESPLGIARVHNRRDIYHYLESISAED